MSQWCLGWKDAKPQVRSHGLVECGESTKQLFPTKIQSTVLKFDDSYFALNKPAIFTFNHFRRIFIRERIQNMSTDTQYETPLSRYNNAEFPNPTPNRCKPEQQGRGGKMGRGRGEESQGLSVSA